MHIQATVTGTGWGGLDQITDGKLAFDPGQHLQRPGLLLLNGAVYVTFGSHGDVGPWHGWLMGYNASDLTQQTAVFNTTPSGAGASIWHSGRGPAADDQGNIYLVTGNGTYDGTSSWSEAVLRLSTTANTTVTDWFTPAAWAALNDGDLDIGSNGPMLIPGTNLLFAAGKSGAAVLLDRTNLGHVAPSDSQAVQNFSLAKGFAIFNSALWPRADGAIAYFWPFSAPLSAYRMVNGAFQMQAISANSTARNALPFSGMSVSANGSVPSSGILWVTSLSSRPVPAPGVLHAFDASNLANELWNSDISGDRDILGGFSKFANPTVANGKVYVPTQTGLVVVYGLLGAAGAGSVVNAASFQNAPVAPGELITVFGLGFSAAEPVLGSVQPNGQYPTVLGDVRVLFDGHPAPLLYVSSGQLNLVVPYSAAGKTTTIMRVISSNGQFPDVTLAVGDVAPALFSQDTSGTGQGAILNQADGSANSPQNPAARGANIIVYATGTGVTIPRSYDGTLASRTDPPKVALPVSVTIGGVPAQVISQTAAPGVISGVAEITARVPAGVQPGPAVLVTITLGTATSPNTVTLAVK